MDSRTLMEASTRGQLPPGQLPGQGSLDSLGPGPVGSGQAIPDETKSVGSLGSVDAEDTLEEGRLFHPDGTRKSSLREVVTGALRSTKYDSVAALLASSTGDRGLADMGKPFGAGVDDQLRGGARGSRMQRKGKGKGKGKGSSTRTGKRKGSSKTGTDRRGYPVQ